MAMGKGEALLESTDLFVNLLNLFKGRGGDLGGHLGQFLKSGGAKIIAQQMPHLFGIGFSENALTLDILQRTEKVNPGSAAKLEKLTNGMNDYERYFFWMTVTSIQLQKVATKQQKPAEKAAPTDQAGGEEIVYQPVSEAELDNRVQSLIFIVKLFEQHGEDATATIRAMYSLRVIEQSWLIRTWSYFSTAIKEKVLDPNGVTSIKELINSQGLLESLKKRNAELRAEAAKMRNNNVDRPSIFIWGLLWTQGGTRGARFKDVYEVHLIIRFAKWIQRRIEARKAKKSLGNQPTEHKTPTFGKKE